jgi:hypothetical protein
MVEQISLKILNFVFIEKSLKMFKIVGGQKPEEVARGKQFLTRKTD